MNALVYGWYGHNNLGDELFKQAISKLFPFNLTFTDTLTQELVDQNPILIIGGGSFLNHAMPGFELLHKPKTILYVGVGGDTEIHYHHQELMKRAESIWIRSGDVDRFKTFCNNVRFDKDLVEYLSIKKLSKVNSKIIYIPNTHVVPNYNSPNWKHAAWNYFKSEMSQVLDIIKPEIFCMCRDSYWDDERMIVELENNSINRNFTRIPYTEDIEVISNIFSEARLVITQRYHGIVLAEMTGTKCIAISHDNKLRRGSVIDYYGFAKDKLLSMI